MGAFDPAFPLAAGTDSGFCGVYRAAVVWGRVGVKRFVRSAVMLWGCRRAVGVERGRDHARWGLVVPFSPGSAGLVSTSQGIWPCRAEGGPIDHGEGSSALITAE